MPQMWSDCPEASGSVLAQWELSIRPSAMGSSTMPVGLRGR